jgi:hypothetical protein
MARELAGRMACVPAGSRPPGRDGHPRSRPKGGSEGQYTARHLTCLPHPVSGPMNIRRSPEAVSREPRCLPGLLSGIHLVPGAFHRRHGVYNSPTGSCDPSSCSRGRSTGTMISTRHYGWVIFSLSVTNLLVEGGIENPVPMVYVALRDSFHWSAAATAEIFSLGVDGGPVYPTARPPTRPHRAVLSISPGRAADSTRLPHQQLYDRTLAPVYSLRYPGDGG